MKKTTKIILIAIITALYIPSVFAQTYDWQKPPKPKETYKGFINEQYDAGRISYKKDKKRNETNYIYEDERITKTTEELYFMLLKDAKRKYGEQIVLRNFKQILKNKDEYIYGCDKWVSYRCVYTVSAEIYTPAPSEPINVVPESSLVQVSTTQIKPKVKVDPLTQAITKALLNIREGSRLALDQVRTINGEDKEDFKDQVVEILLDEGYKVVAKEYLDRLYEEQQSQQSGIYNDRTTVQENNFSAVGYYINVKKSDTSIKVQIINVSTGEYESNVTVNID